MKNYYKLDYLKNFLLFLIFLLYLLLKVIPVEAAKSRIRTIGKTSSSTKRVTGIVFSTAKMSRATNSVVLTFVNLGKAKMVNYSLSYRARAINQGVVGSINPNGLTTTSRDLYFGTCSKGVCTPHTNITGATIIVTTTLIDGSTNTKRYRLKV